MTRKKASGRTAPAAARKTTRAAAKDTRSVDLKSALRETSGVRTKPEPLLLPETMVLPGKGREGLKGVVIYLNDAAKDQLARLSISQRRTVQDLGVEAINLLFRRYREKPIG
jgi:hypothetical protein